MQRNRKSLFSLLFSGIILVKGIKDIHVMKSTLNELNFPTSGEELMKSITWPQPKLRLSDTKTLLSQIRFSLTTKTKDVNTTLVSFNDRSLRSAAPGGRRRPPQQQPQFSMGTSSRASSLTKMGDLVVTPSISAVIDFITPWIGSHEAVLLVGPRGVGKDAIVRETFFPQGRVIHTFCCPDTTTTDIIRKMKESCSFTSSPTGKAMRASNGAKLILYFRNLELLMGDQWNSIPVIAFLVSLISHGGFYDEGTLEWVSVQNFIVIGTCTSIDCLDMRLLNRVHVSEVSLPPLEEMEKIIPFLGPPSSTSSSSTGWKVIFAKFFCKIIHDMTSSSSSSSALSSSGQPDSGFLESSPSLPYPSLLPTNTLGNNNTNNPPIINNMDVMRMCLEVISLLSRYDVVDEEIIQQETRRVLINYRDDYAGETTTKIAFRDNINVSLMRILILPLSV